MGRRGEKVGKVGMMGSLSPVGQSEDRDSFINNDINLLLQKTSGKPKGERHKLNLKEDMKLQTVR